MEISSEEENFIKLAKIFLDAAPRYLRELFIDKWNQKHPNKKWQSDNEHGALLIEELPPAIRNNNKNNLYLKKMKSGNEKDWDTTTLVFVMLFSQLNLIEGCRPKHQRSSPLHISEEIDIIRETRNKFFAHASSMKCSSDTFKDIVSKMKTVAKNVFGGDAENEISRIEKLPVKVVLTDQQKQQLDVEKNGSYELEKRLKGNGC